MNRKHHTQKFDEPDAGDFAPTDLTDSRGKYEWKTGYPPEAKRKMWREAAYLFGILILTPILMICIGAGCHEFKLCNVNESGLQKFVLYSNAWLAGTLGGTLFTLKWLYHCRAKGFWSEDRIFWRFFTPHLSGGLAFIFYVLVSSGFISVIDTSETSNPSVAMSIGFIVGYFSDKAIAKLSEVADTLFGSREIADTIRDKDKDDNTKEAPDDGQK